MRAFSPKLLITGISIAAILGIGVFVYLFWQNVEDTEPISTVPMPEEEARLKRTILGQSLEGREIEAYAYGDGQIRLAFVGGIHGGYEWNSVLLAYTLIDYFEENTHTVPETMSVTVIPSLNPDGVYAVIGKEGRFTTADVPSNGNSALGRFNAHDVDLNRNFDCKWKPESTWRTNPVSAGTGPFSEPESNALRRFVLDYKPHAVVFWHSQANAVYASECEGGILPETLDIMDVYAKAGGYDAVESFDHYEVTGDAEGWLASIGIPAITVELQTHETIEWERNLAGVEALFEYYGQK